MTSTWALDEESATAAIEVAWFLAGDELDRIHGGADGAIEWEVLERELAETKTP